MDTMKLSEILSKMEKQAQSISDSLYLLKHRSIEEVRVAFHDEIVNSINDLLMQAKNLDYHMSVSMFRNLNDNKEKANGYRS